MPRVSEMFPRKYLRGQDLSAPTKVTIEAVRQEDVFTPGKGKERKWILRAKGARRGVVLGPKLAGEIAAVVGSENTDDWPGHVVVLYPEAVEVAGQEKQAIRARAVEEVREDG